MIAVVLCCVAGAAAGQEPPDLRLQQAQTAFDEAIKFWDAGRYAEAIARGEHALALREAVLGSTHPEVARCLDVLGFHLLLLGNSARAESLLQRALAIREAALGKNHPDTGQTLNNLGRLYADQRSYGRAEPLYKRALAIREAARGKNHPDVADLLMTLASLYADQGLYGQAEPLYKRGLAIREAALGKNHPDVAGSLVTLASLYADQGMHGRAEPLYKRALAILHAASGKDPAEVDRTLTRLASIYEDQGLYAHAQPLRERVLAIREEVLGKNHHFVAIGLRNLARLYENQGLYSQAEPLYERTLAIQEATLGKNHPDVAHSLMLLASLYVAQGLYTQAEPLLQRSLAIREAALGKDHFDVAWTLNRLGRLYEVQELYDRAEPLYERALAVFEAPLGKHHRDVGGTLNNLGRLYVAQGLYARAEPLLQRAATILEAALGKKHPTIAEVLNSLADIYLAQGEYARAGPFYERAIAIWEPTLGKDHPNIARTLNHLAEVRLAQHRLTEALSLLTRAFAMSEQRLRRESLGFSEVRLARFLQRLRADEERLYALLRAHPDDAHVRRLVLGAALLRKGRSVEEMAGISRTVYQSLDAQDRDTFKRLGRLRAQLAQLSLQGPGSLPLSTYQQRLEELAKQSDALEAGLAKRSAPLRALAALPSPAEIVDRVATALPKDAALVEFITYVDRPLVPRPGMPDLQRPNPMRYLALVLFPDATIRLQDLGAAEPIDLAASRLRDALANRDAAFQAPAQALYQLVFQPLIPLLGDTHRLFLSPDGQLALVPFAALHDGQQFLVDAFDFTYVPSGKNLLPRSQESSSSDAVVVLADPDFSASLPALAHSQEETPALAERSTSIERSLSALRAELAHRTWAPVPLPGTRQEAEAIQRMLPQAQLFLGPEATKEQLLHLPTPGILHLATHGFFLEDGPGPTASRAVGHFGALGDSPPAARPPDPLLRSGLLLAGASASAPSGSRSPSPPYGALVTALELASLNLWGTQLVVLSACDTGRGDVKLGQGVYGLRRAFLVAGAETVVMSLWKVNDETTRELMEGYYQHLLAGRGRATALREAMRELRWTQPHPHFWAPFIAMGRDAPLDLLPPSSQEAHHR
jgi:CHAT domain-containing protein/tetratricopeptide (TPR) repeat protein